MLPSPATDRQTALQRWPYRGTRPGEGWHAHGTTSRTLTLLSGDGLVCVTLDKQRWRDRATGCTCHSRPPWEEAWASYGLCVVMTLVGLWLMAREGLHRLSWPWPRDRPARRTVQRWKALLRPHAQAWMQVIRLAVIDRISPRPLEETVPVAGIPPPTRKVRHQESDSTPDGHLQVGIWLLKRVARLYGIPIRTLLVEAKARWPGSTHIPEEISRS